MYIINVRFTSRVSKFYFDDFIARHFSDYKICEYAKNEKEYSIFLSRMFDLKTVNINKVITEVSEILDQENSFHIMAYEEPEAVILHPATKAKDGELEVALKKAGRVADLIIEKAEREKEKASNL